MKNPHVSTPIQLLSNAGKKLLATTAITAVGFLSLTHNAKAADDWTGHTVTGGGGSISYDPAAPANTTNITQTGHRVRVSGDGDIKNGWTVNVAQDSDTSQYILFDMEGDATQIRGNLNANGEIFIFNQDGVIFGANSQVNVGSIVASSGTLASTDTQLDSGNIIINSIDTDGDVRNNGNITVADAGLAAFVAPNVTNNGNINAKVGTVAMAAGQTVTLDMYGDGLFEVAVSGELGDGLLQNQGNITARGGIVNVSAAVAKTAVENVINMGGSTKVTSATVKGGKIILNGGESGRVNVRGELHANGGRSPVTGVVQDGGSIEISGQAVRVTSNGEVRANSFDTGKAGEITLAAADKMDILGEVSAEDQLENGTVNIKRISSGTIGLGNATDVFKLAQSEINRITTGNLNVGGENTTAVNVENVDATTPGLPGIVSLIAGDVSGDINFAGNNTFRELVARSEDDIALNSGSTLSTTSGDLTLLAGTAAGQADINIDGDINTNGGNLIANAFDDIRVRANVLTGGGDVTLTTQDIPTVSEVSVTSAGKIETAGGDVTINTDDIFISDIAGTRIDAGTGDVSIKRVSEGTISLGSNTGDLDISAGEITSIVAGNLSIGGDLTTTMDVEGVDTSANIAGKTTLNALGTDGEINFSGLNNFNAIDVNANNRINVEGGVNTTGGDINMDSKGTTWTDFVNIDSTGSLNSNGGDITLASNTGGLIVKGAIDSTDGDIDLSGQQVQMVWNSTINGKNVNFDTLRAYQTETSTLTAASISGEVQSDAEFLGAANDIGEIGDFATGLGNWHDGGFTLANSINGLNIVGALSTQGGDIDIKAKDNINVQSTASVTTNGGNYKSESGKLFDLDNGANFDMGTGDVTINSQVINLGDDIVTTGKINGDASRVNVENDNAQIQDGVDVARRNATIDVAAGRYNESVIVNESGLKILGANAGQNNLFGARNPESIVTGGSPAFTIKKDNISIDGFTLDGAALTYGVKLEDVKGIKVVNNIIKNSSIAAIGGVIDHDNASQVDLLVQYNKIDGTNTGDAINIEGDGGGVPANGNALVGSRVDILNNLIGSNADSVDGSAIVFSALGDVDGNADAFRGKDVTTNSEINILNNQILADDDGVRFEGVVGESDINISDNNRITGFGGEGIQFTHDVIDSDVTISNITTLSGRNGGAVFNGSVDNSKVDITNNKTVFSFLGDAIEFTDVKNDSDINITGNKGNFGISSGVNAIEVISVSGASNIEISNNAIQGTENGVLVTGANPTIDGDAVVNVEDNDITNKKIGINADGVSNLSITKNNIDGGVTGVSVKDSKGANVSENKIGLMDSLSGEGILLEDSNEYKISKNEITDTGANGIKVINSDDGFIQGNNVSATGFNGIAVIDSDNATVNTANIVDDTFAAGISLNRTTNSLVDDNDISNTGGSGVWISKAGGTTVSNNEIDTTWLEASRGTGAGVHVDRTTGATVSENTISNVTRNGSGVTVISGKENNVIGNDITNAALDGIHIENSDDVVIDDNDIFGTAGGSFGRRPAAADGANRYGIFVSGGEDATINNNRIKGDAGFLAATGLGAVADGIHVESNEGVDITNNSITGDLGLPPVGGAGGNGIFVSDSKRAFVDTNTIIGVGDNGIDVTGSNRSEISNNIISLTGGNGIAVNDSKNSDVNDNNVSFSADNGIEVASSKNAVINDNDVTNVGNDGINVKRSNNVEILDNTVNAASGDGIDVERSKLAQILDNTVSNTGDDGIELTKSNLANIRRNTIEDIGDDGVDVDNSNNVDVINNTISEVSENGIQVTGSNDIEVKRNTISETDENGIEVTNSDSALIKKNVISSADLDGIKVRRSDDLNLINNDINDVERDGINLRNSNDVEIKRNEITNAGRDGIKAARVDMLDVVNNDVDDAGRDGLSVNGSYDAFIARNTINGSGDDGVDAKNIYKATLRANKVDNSGDNGIGIINQDPSELSSGKYFDVALISGKSKAVINNNIVSNSDGNGVEVGGFEKIRVVNGNEISNSLENGLNVSGGDNGDVVVAGNTFTDNDTAALFKSGNIDLTGDGNSFVGGRVAMKFSSEDLSPAVPMFADLNLVGNTLGTQTFDGQTESYVELENGALFAPGSPTLLNALDSTYVSTPFGTVTPSSDFAAGFTPSQVAFFESRFVHFNDNGNTGLFFFPLLPEINQEDILRFIGPNAAALSGLNVTILGLPTIPGGAPVALNNIAPAAGGETSPEELNEIATAAGGEDSGSETSCYGDALSLVGSGQPATVSYGGGIDDLLNSEAGCGS